MTKNQEYLERTIFIKDALSTRDFTDYYKNYYIVINGYYDTYDFMKILIYKLNEKNNIIKVYENNSREEILEMFGKNLQENSYNTVHKKIVNFIKTYDL